MTLRKIVVETTLLYNNGSTEIKQFSFDTLGCISQKTITNYIRDNTINCLNIQIIDVWIEV